MPPTSTDVQLAHGERVLSFAAHGSSTIVSDGALGTRWRPGRLWTGAGLFALGAAALVTLACTPPAPPPPQNLLFISLDTTRKDHLPTYGYERDTAPYLDELARQGVVFENAVAQWPTTNPSHTSMFSGLYPKTHGVGTNTRKLAPEHTTLAEILRDAGFRTGAFVSGYPLRLAQEGMGQGFDTYDARFKKMRRDGRETTDLAIEWLRSLGKDEPFFLFLHLYDAHGPYRPRGAYKDLFRSEDPGRELGWIPGYQQREDAEGRPIRRLNPYVDRYDAMIRYLDDLVRDVVAAVDLDHTLVLVTADHGETLGERHLVLDHGKNLFEEQVGIPLILHVPGQQPKRIAQPAEQVDFLPTLVDLLGVGMPEGLVVEGRNLASLVTGAAGEERTETAFSTARIWPHSHADRGYLLDKERRMHAARLLDWKLIVYPGLEEDFVELYDLGDDPSERRNVAAEHPDVVAGLRQAMDAWHQGGMAEAEEENLSDEDVENLKALGYLGDS